MNEATIYATIDSYLKSKLDRNEMYDVSHEPGFDGGIGVSISGIYNNCLYNKTLLFHISLIPHFKEDTVTDLLSVAVSSLRTLGVPKNGE